MNILKLYSILLPKAFSTNYLASLESHDNIYVLFLSTNLWLDDTTTVL